MNVQTESEYEDLLSLWSDLEAGLAVVLASPSSVQEFQLRVWQYDRWMQDLLQRDADVGLYLLFQLATNSSVGYSASHALVCAVLCHLIAVELNLDQGERDSLVHAAFTMNIGMTELQDELANQLEKPSPMQQDAIRAHPVKGGMVLANLGILDGLWLDIVTSHHNDLIDKGRAGPVRPWLGMATEEFRGRLFVSRLSPDGPAARAGLQRGDILVGVGSEEVSSLADFYKKIWARGAAGIEVPLRVLQGTQVRDVNVRSIDRIEYFRAKPML